MARQKSTEAPKVNMTVRISADLAEHYRAMGPGWSRAFDEALRIGTKGLFRLGATPGPKPDMTPKVPKRRPGLRVPSEAEVRDTQEAFAGYKVQVGPRTPAPGSMLKKR